MLHNAHSPPAFRVQVICDTSLAYFRNVTLGARHYGFATKRMILLDNWNTDMRHDLAKNVHQKRIDGIIAQIRNQELEEQLFRLSIPVVDISNSLSPSRFPVVSQDDTEIGRQAAEHLLRCGCSVFGFWGQKNAPYSFRRKEAFKNTLALKIPDGRLFEMEGPSILKKNGPSLVRHMENWLKKLLPPLGIFSVMDTFALHLIQAAQNLGLRVPEDVAILGAGDDEYWVEFGSIPISSVCINARKIGYEAAALLDKLMTKNIKTAPNRYLSGSEVFARHSTDVLFVKDQAVANAVAYVRKHANKNIYVGDVVKAAGVSRSGLQLRFKKTLGHSMLDEIQNARIAHVQMLLRSTNLQLPEVAEACDFADTPALHVMFRRVTGKTPAKYRALFRQL